MELDGISIENKLKIVDRDYDNSKMNKDDFLKVLLADIKWQNPMDVNDINDFINNSVKLREIEILNSFEDTINALKELNGSNSLLMASNLIGKKVQYEGNLTYIENGRGKISFELEGFADKVKVSVMDKNGNVIETKDFQFLEPNREYPIEIENPELEDGYYTVYVEAFKNNEKVSSKITSEAYVEGALKDKTNIYVIFGNKSIPIEKIKQIGGVNFEDLIARSITSFSNNSPKNLEIGGGAFATSTVKDFSQGALMNTNSSTDLALDGEGFFMVKDNQGVVYYTRAGQFRKDASGNLINTNGMKLLGWALDETGNMAGSLNEIKIPNDMPPKVTTKLAFKGPTQTHSILEMQQPTTM